MPTQEPAGCWGGECGNGLLQVSGGASSAAAANRQSVSRSHRSQCLTGALCGGVPCGCCCGRCWRCFPGGLGRSLIYARPMRLIPSQFQRLRRFPQERVGLPYHLVRVLVTDILVGSGLAVGVLRVESVARLVRPDAVMGVVPKLAASPRQRRREPAAIARPRASTATTPRSASPTRRNFRCRSLETGGERKGTGGVVRAQRRGDSWRIDITAVDVLQDLYHGAHRPRHRLGWRG